MSYGLEQYGLGSWGGGNFIVINQVPTDLSVGVNRLPLISCTLSSQSDVVLASINLSVNGIALITNGIFTTAASGSIDSTNLREVQIVGQVLHEFAPLEQVIVTVTAVNTSNEPPTNGNVWSFFVDDTIHTFQMHIVRAFERVLRVNSTTPLQSPQNPHSEVNLGAPGNLMGVTV